MGGYTKKIPTRGAWREMRQRFERKDILILVSSGSTLRRTVFTVACLIALLGSSFRPMPGPDFAKGSVDPSLEVLAGALPEDETEDRGLYYTVYQVAKGDTISGIADRFDVSVDTVISFNGIQSAKGIKPGQTLKIPSMSGILYTTKAGDTSASLAESWKISSDRIVVANGLMSEAVQAGRRLFLPDAKMPAAQLREISGDLFRWPINGYITSWYGWRRDPFNGRNSFHSALDIGAPMGTPIGAAMEGRVADVGYSPITGKYVVINHGGGWTSLYGHMSVIYAQEGQSVARGARIGLVGNTGYSTGPHLHFSVLKNGKTVNPANVLQ